MRRRRRQLNKSREEAEKIQKAKEEITKSWQSLEKSEDALMKGEEEVRADLKAADVAWLSNSELLIKHLNCMMPSQQQL